MHAATRHSAGKTPRRATLWFAFLGGAIAWTLHLIFAYLIAEFGCETEMDQHHWLGIMAPAWLLIGLSAVMLLVSGAATLAGFLARRHLRDVKEERITDYYLAHSGYIMSGLFTFIIAVQCLPIFFYLQSC